MRGFGVGMIGYGFMGRMHTYSYASLPFVYDPPPARIRLVGVAAASEVTRAFALERGGYEFATSDYNDLLRRDDIHLVNICTPNYLHFEQAMAAIAAGKHVYCDKPLALDSAQARQMAQAARAAGTTCQVTFHNRFSPAMMRARQLAEDGFFGEVVSFRCAYLHSGYLDPARPMSWRLRKEASGGGALVDLGSHAIDLLRMLAGDIRRVRADLRTIVTHRPASTTDPTLVPVDVDDAAYLQLELAGGGSGTLEASRVAAGSQDDLRLEIHGTRGALRFDLMDPNWLYVYDDTKPHGELGRDRGWQRIECIQAYPKPSALPGGRSPVGWSRFHIASIYEFVHNAAQGQPGRPSFDDGLAVQQVMDAALRSSRSGDWEDVE